jgi:hypothetical protein
VVHARRRPVDLASEDSSELLQTALEGAIREESKLKSEAERRESRPRRRKLAKDQLEDAEAKYDGPTLEAVRDIERRRHQ